MLKHLIKILVNASIVGCIGKVTVVAKYVTIYVRTIYTSIWTCQGMVYMYVKEEKLPFMYIY